MNLCDTGDRWHYNHLTELQNMNNVAKEEKIPTDI